ncbi:LacI family DNA-binding transcriptional regulator [Paraburkholderia rhizosphaerae]|uniref:LacI family transcriptional regulator n=1 Tax=Paraburkholderia rhizosphaerae TaxID=480658 RepID=A0A4R8LIM3_9BURK|nr:LacI family DNA-binding transcriptional regulator [Paraburkholderia rhizosphaerae]TDY42705.1 LacI family transcriptional regulator [Paraburkholderia rhizosphaerae]
MTPTIKDVAAHAGFSIATVSRAINAPHTVNPVTLEKVRQSIEALGFRPSPLGRQLRGERSRLIGVVLPTIANPVFAECLQGIDELAAAQGFRLMLMTTQYDAERERHAIETLREQRVEGLILTVADADTHPLLDELDHAGMLYVLMHNDTVRRPSVSVDNRLAAFEGVRMLIAHGHRRILMLAGTLAASDRARLRHVGYSQAMQQAGLTPAPALEIDFNANELAPSVLAHLTGNQRPTALFCSNDLLAMVVMRGLRRARFDVPRDMSILGFDGLAMGELLAPPLASIGSPNREIGCAAWRRLISRIDGTYADASLSLTLPHTLREGATIAAISNHADAASARRSHEATRAAARLDAPSYKAAHSAG